MDPDLRNLCEQVFDAGVDTVFKESLKMQRNGFFEPPLVGGSWAVAEVEEAKQAVCRAAIARAWWELHKPSWSPPLPLSDDEIREALNGETVREHFVGNFAQSLRYADWDFRVHPSFHDFCCGIIALRPDFLKHVPELGLRPKKLPGFNPRIMCWERASGPQEPIETGLAR
jgi:hypothetical protein